MEKWVNSLRGEAEHLTVRQLDFSGSTYQVEVYDPQLDEALWTFLQFSKEEKLKDAFCSCTRENEKCIHLAAAYLKIYGGKKKPLHVLFDRSLWNRLCRLCGEETGFEERFLEKRGEGCYIYRNEIFFEIKTQDRLATTRLHKLLEDRTKETPENSIKFSNLPQEEIVRWREGRPSRALRYTLSFWSDFARWMMEENADSYLRFEEDDKGWPTKLFAQFSSFTVSFEIKLNDVEKLIPSLSTISSNLQLFVSQEERVQNIRFDEERVLFHIDHHPIVQNSKLKGAIPLKEWFYIRQKGFYPKKGMSLMSLDLIPKELCVEFLDQFHDEIARFLSLSDAKHTLNYVLHFDEKWNWHFEPYLFEQGDIKERGLWLEGRWAYLLGKGFYRLDEPLFDEGQKELVASSVSLFVNRHRIWLNQQKGFETHLSSIESQLAYLLTESSLRFFSRAEGKATEMRDFGDWIFYSGLGFFSKQHASLGMVVQPGLEVARGMVSAFVKANREELELVPHFFTSRFPFRSRSLEMRPLSDGSIEIVPVVVLKEGFSGTKIHLFEDYVYLEGEGFCQIPAEMRLPLSYSSRTTIREEDFEHFFDHELAPLKGLISYVDPRLQQPHSTDLALHHLARGKAGLVEAKLFVETELGLASVVELLAALKKKKRFCFTGAGLIDLAHERFGWLKALKGAWNAKKKSLTLTTLELIRLDALTNLKLAPPPHDEETRRFLQELREFSTHIAPDTGGMQCSLRLYQESGLRWLWFLYRNGLSGLLCDDMGLGKTHQAMALLAASVNHKPNAAYLVVCPTSVIYHWQDKLQSYLPHIDVQTFHGLRRTFREMERGGVLLTSYGILRVEKELWKKLSFDVAIFDEIQVAKNPSSRVHKALQSVNAYCRIGLTGTPIENNLRELKSLFDIVLPGYMPSEARFKELFTLPIERNNDEEKKGLLSQLTRPFVLRRKKSEVLQELPEKSEDNCYCELSEDQLKLYRHVLETARQGIIPSIQDASQKVNYVHIFSIFSQLKQVCDHPALYFKQPKHYKEYGSGKWERFVELLEEAHESRQKVVVFSQYLFMLDIIEHHLKEKGWGYAQIRGDTVNRAEELRRFSQDPSCTLFIGSLQAAGLGIDLTAASVVILYDRWWNAARENQAIDRVHRLGQKWRVLVYKLITKNTIEEKIDRMIALKGRLLEEVIATDDENVFKSFTREELMELLSFSAQDG